MTTQLDDSLEKIVFFSLFSLKSRHVDFIRVHCLVFLFSLALKRTLLFIVCLSLLCYFLSIVFLYNVVSIETCFIAIQSSKINHQRSMAWHGIRVVIAK